MITGPTAGIGREYAIQLARDHGLNVVLIGRSIDKLKNLTGEIGEANSRIILINVCNVQHLRMSTARLFSSTDPIVTHLLAETYT